MKKNISINIHQISTGFVEIPNQISLNIYVQGCKKKCNGCQNSELQSFDNGSKLFLNDVDQLIKDYPLCKWVCWLGGDAIYQSDSLKKFSKKFQKEGLKVCLYTGVNFEDIDWKILCNLNMIVDGEWKGKPIQDPETNQRIWILCPGIEWYQVTWKELQEMYKENKHVA